MYPVECPGFLSYPPGRIECMFVSAKGQESLGAALDALEAAIDALGGVEHGVETARARREGVVRLRRLGDRLESEWCRAVGELDRRGDWEAEGAVSAVSWLRARCRTTPGRAAGAVRTARRLGELPGLARAWGAGEVSGDHVRVVTGACTPGRVGALGSLEATLVDAARRLGPRELGWVVRHATDALDGDGGAGAARACHERRRLSVSPTLGGMVALDGLLDAEAGEVVITALEAVMDTDRRHGPADEPAPSTPQRRADALVGICRHVLGDPRGLFGGDTTPTRRHRPQVVTVVDLAWLETRAGTTGPALVETIRAEAIHTGALSAETLRRISCDAAVSRVITTGGSEPLDVGRASRTVTPAQWRALLVRDRHCVFPGCDRPPGWCEAHHLVHWTDHGPTNLPNLALVCWAHHHKLHEGRWTLQAHPDRTWTATPPHPTTPPRHQRPPPHRTQAAA